MYNARQFPIAVKSAHSDPYKMDHSDIDISDLLADDEDEHYNLSDVIPSITSTPAPQPVIIEDRSLISDLARPIKIIHKFQSKSRKRPSTAKPKRTIRTKASSKKPKVRSRPQSAYVNTRSAVKTKSKSKSTSKTLQTAIRRFEELQKTQIVADKKRRGKNAKYNPNQWFDSNLVRGVDDWREENYRLRSEVSGFKKENAKLKCQIKTLEKQNAKRAKEIQALITVALQNNEQQQQQHGDHGTFTKNKKRNKKYRKYSGSGNLKQTELLMQLRHEQSIHGSLRQKIKSLKQEIKQNRKQMTRQQMGQIQEREYDEYKWEDLQIEIQSLRQRLRQKDEVIENTKISEREQLEMQFKILCDAKDSELREVDRDNERLEEQCKVLMEELEESTKYRETQKKSIQTLEQKAVRMVLLDEFMDKLYRQQQIQGVKGGYNEHNLSHRIADKLYSNWTQIKGGDDVDIDRKVAEWNIFFGEMDGLVVDLTKQLHVIRNKLKAKEILNCEEAEEE